MKKYLILLVILLTGISYAYAESQEPKTQRYVVANKKGKARFVPVEREGDYWKFAQPREDIYIENGVELEGFDIPEESSLNYSGTHYVYSGGIVVSYEDKYYLVVFPKKDIKPINEKGEVTGGLGFRNYLSNTALGDFYRTPGPGVLGLVCAFVAAIFMFWGLFKENVPAFIIWGFSVPVCVISLLEIGAAFSVGTDAAWWVNPDDVGYWIATPLLIPYALVAALMIFSYKIYSELGKLDDPANNIVSALMFIGIGLTVISAIFVVINFLFAVCMLIGAAYIFKGVSYKDAGGNTINSGPLGTTKTDKYGKTTRID